MNRLATERTTLPPRGTSLAILLIFATLGTLLGLVAAGDSVLGFDVTVLKAVQRLDFPGLATLVRIANAAVDTKGALAFAVLFIALALVLDRRIFVLQLALVIALRLAAQGLKLLFDSPRPGIAYQPDPSLIWHTNGFPSGHAYTATVITTMLVLFVHSLDVPRWVRVASIAVAVGSTAFALFARVWIGAHWPTDTIGGVLFGIATVALMQLIVGVILDGKRALTGMAGADAGAR